MTKDQLHQFIEAELETFSERMSGNEVNAIMAERLQPMVSTERQSLVEVLRDLISVRIPNMERQPSDAVREARLWLALDVAERLRLNELLPDVESLLQDIHLGRTLLPVYEPVVRKYLARLRG